jgi:glycosyltransferase involved in cell wall biosynthesis
MKVVMLTPDSYMIDRRIILEARTLISAGHEVVLLAGFECAREEHYTEHGIEVHRYTYDWDDERLKKIRRYLPRNASLIALFTRLYMFIARRCFGISPFDRFIISKAMAFDADVYHVHDLPCLKAGYHAARAKGASLVYDAHELYYSQVHLSAVGKKTLFNLERRLIRFADAVITVNHFIARLMADRYAIPEPRVILNCTERPQNLDMNEARRTLREKAGIPQSARVVLYQGWISSERNIETLIRGVRHFSDDVVLALIGYGAHEEVLRNVAREEGVDGRVVFLGQIPNDEMLRYTAGADLGVVPYLPVDENHLYCSPNKFFEFVLAGVPVIAHDMPFFRVMQESYGVVYIADMTSPRAFGEAVTALLGRDVLLEEMKEKCAAAGRELNWDREGEKLVAIYETVAAKSAGRPRGSSDGSCRS